ncbi:hypothetical protein LPC08_07265 [Roseomonas sp. OT10]|uniref:COG4223 family protein n=1 Tax=Roseomonas cutis TaxID=2897332 RepID=UPI001E59C9FF|nr:mitofilin family membrane protein [Roseomonas sp. OT10]UFN50410.1 hypothetical protein LPC08_07265 [Roseomonas sp. OT10]
MSDSPATPPEAAPAGAAPRAASTLPPSPPAKWLDPAVLPILVGIVVLGGALAFLFSSPRSGTAPGEDLRGQIAAIDGRIAALEGRPNPAAGLPERIQGNERRLATLESTAQDLASRPPGDPSNKPAIEALAARLQGLEGREHDSTKRLEESLAGLEADLAQRRAAADARRAETDRQLDSRLAAIEGRQAEAGRLIEQRAATADTRIAEAERRAEQRTTTAEAAFQQRIAAAEKQLADRIGAAEAAVQPRLAALDQSIAQRVEAANQEMDRRMEAQAAALDQRLATIDQRLRQAEAAERRVGFLAARGAIQAALEAGRPLGGALAGLPGTPPAPLARYASAAPPTEASLRLSFEEAARAARDAAQPQGQGVMDSALSRIQGLVTVRRGEEVVVGDRVSGELEIARRALEAGDLEAAIARLERLPPPSKAAMEGWLAQARGLQAARNALGELSAERSAG